MSDDEDSEWNPNLSEISKLLNKLGLSPPQTEIDYENSSSSSQKLQTDSDYDDNSLLSSISITDDESSANREEMVNKLVEYKKNEQAIRYKNFWLTEYLIEYFSRKQMIYVMSEGVGFDDSEGGGEEEMDYYCKQLKRFDKFKKKFERFEENSEEELREIREEIIKKSNEADELIMEIAEREKNIQENSRGGGKNFLNKKIQEIINRQLEKMKIISKYRLTYIKLRNDLQITHENLKSIIRKNSNLTKMDYERLEAEKYFYLQQFDQKNLQLKNLLSRKKKVITKIRVVNSQAREVATKIQKSKLESLELNKKILELELQKSKTRNKISTLKIVLSNLNYNYLNKNNEYFAIINNQHEKWIKKIARQLKELKLLRQKMNAIKTNFILHEKNI
ncbi:A-kinase anchor protein 9-like [Microplitis mediator]|uniref:A-kinase anchor protein 9-like n=1 Tax=Microplitis mediator TaxID=375433 RepID=UPI0025534BE7|nr:A-kinase anchor protein 9-like [Microplitis mediator]